jgi:hypothetical protein
MLPFFRLELGIILGHHCFRVFISFLSTWIIIKSCGPLTKEEHLWNLTNSYPVDPKFCPRHYARPKMVTIHQQFCEEKLHAPSAKLCCMLPMCSFFLFSLGEGAKGGVGVRSPWFPMCSYHIFNGFLSRSQFVPHVLLILSSTFQIAPLFYPICFGKCCPPLTYRDGPKGRNMTLLLWRLLHV